MDRMPYPYIQMNPKDMDELKLKQGDLVEVYNDNGSTQAMVYPTPTARPKQTFMLFAYPTGVQGNVVSDGVNEFIIPNYKQTWANIRKLADAPGGREAPELQVARIHRLIGNASSLNSCPVGALPGQIFRRYCIQRAKQDAGMSVRKANQLTLSGFCAFYIGLMGILIAINVPVISGFRRPVVLVLSALALAGVALMLVGGLTKVDESEGF